MWPRKKEAHELNSRYCLHCGEVIHFGIPSDYYCDEQCANADLVMIQSDVVIMRSDITVMASDVFVEKERKEDNADI